MTLSLVILTLLILGLSRVGWAAAGASLPPLLLLLLPLLLLLLLLPPPPLAAAVTPANATAPSAPIKILLDDVAKAVLEADWVVLVDEVLTAVVVLTSLANCAVVSGTAVTTLVGIRGMAAGALVRAKVASICIKFRLLVMGEKSP